jgi:hypothetical protein
MCLFRLCVAFVLAWLLGSGQVNLAYAAAPAQQDVCQLSEPGWTVPLRHCTDVWPLDSRYVLAAGTIDRRVTQHWRDSSQFLMWSGWLLGRD